MSCGRRYALNIRPRAYPQAVRDRVRELHAGGWSSRQIAQELSISPQTVSTWVRTAPAEPASAPPPAEQPAKQRTTIADVARHANVSTATVSNYLNDRGRMSLDTRLRIAEAMKTLYFTPNALVQAIRRRRTHTLGLVTYGIYDLEHHLERSIVSPMLGAINRAADKAGYDVLLYTGWPHRSRSHTGSDFLNGQIDGLLWISPRLSHPQIRFAAAGGLPVVSLLSRRVPDGVGYVVADNVGGMQELVQYLAAQGHTRIAFLGSRAASDFIDRYAGYREGLAVAGLALDPEIVMDNFREEHWSPLGIGSVLERWLLRPDRPTALVTVDDILAEYAIEWLHGCGLTVPADVAVTGFNGLPFTETLFGGITTLRQPFGEIGRVAVERLDALIQGTPLTECRVTVPVSLLVRASTQL
jgi:DNA-binding LacI/PurR family transcriptional regulator